MMPAPATSVPLTVALYWRAPRSERVRAVVRAGTRMVIVSPAAPLKLPPASRHTRAGSTISRSSTPREKLAIFSALRNELATSPPRDHELAAGGLVAGRAVLRSATPGNKRRQLAGVGLLRLLRSEERRVGRA